jgi:hypothetical protein
VTAPAGAEPLRQTLLRLCDRVDSCLAPGAAKQVIAEVRERLGEDVLRVAVGGRLNAGKSTLVNALLGQKLAATDATECTTKVTWFRFGQQNRIQLRLRDGGQVTLVAQPLDEAIAASGRPAAEVASVLVESPNAVLRRDHIVVDTPGLDSLTGLDEDSLAALSHADVLLYVMPHPGENDFQALAALRASAARTGITAISTLGVLSRIDQLGEGADDPWPVAYRLADRYAKQLAALLAGVIPVAGLLAETALGDSFTEADVRPLRLLAGTDAGTLAAALYTEEDFIAHPGLPVAAPDRERLLSLLGIYGIRAAVEEISRGAAGATDLLRALRTRSGVDALLDRLHAQFLAIADQLRARQALRALEAATWLGSTPAEKTALAGLRTDLRSVSNDPRLRELDLAAALTDLNAGRWRATPEITAEVAALATGRGLHAKLGTDPGATSDQLRALLSARIAAWRGMEGEHQRLTAGHARTVREYLEYLYFSLPAC